RRDRPRAPDARSASPGGASARPDSPLGRGAARARLGSSVRAAARHPATRLGLASPASERIRSMSEEREGADTKKHDDLAKERLVSIRNVPDEATATLLRDFLRSQGIEANAVPVQMPWLSTLETLHYGSWGRI